MSGPGMTLESLVGDVATFRERQWKRACARYRVEPLPLITREEILEQLDGGLLAWPYFAVLRDGRPLPREAVTTTRKVLNVTVAGFPRQAAVLAELRDGAALLLRQPEHWHAPIRAVVRGVAAGFEGRVRGAVLLTPEGAPATAAETDELDGFVLQLAGCTRWTVDGHTHELTPGDVLYLPYSAAREARAVGGDSVHLVLAVAEPTPKEIVDAVVAELRRRIEADDEARQHHLIPAARKGEWLVERVTAYRAELDGAAVARAGVRRRGRRTAGPMTAATLAAPVALRARTPEHTWEIVRPRLRRYGISRVAELTGLDVIGLPVYMAVRPLATTVGVSQGKGMTPLLAKLSAVMESIEVCVIERFRPADAIRCPAAELGLPFHVAELTSTERSLVSDHTPLSWVPAASLADGAQTFLPVRSIALDGVSDGQWAPRTLVASSNGLASGNNLAEATVHALFEVVERHCVAGLAHTPIDQRRVLDLATIPAGWCADFIGGLRRDGFWVEVVDCSDLPGTTTFVAYVWRSDMPSPYAGSGCHTSPEIALFRAVTEAVQSRMSVISGLREDIGLVAYQGVRRPAPPAPVPPNHSWPHDGAPAGGWTLDGLVAHITAHVSAVSRRPVLRVDLTPPDEEFAVCKVIAPGLDFDVYRQLIRDHSGPPPGRPA